MKKSILILTVVALGFAACTSNSTETTTTDSTAVDTAAVVDSTAVTATDSNVAKLPVEETK
jgi:ABC-type oligopeptide transport system substrate-binding subunit